MNSVIVFVFYHLDIILIVLVGLLYGIMLLYSMYPHIYGKSVDEYLNDNFTKEIFQKQLVQSDIVRFDQSLMKKTLNLSLYIPFAIAAIFYIIGIHHPLVLLALVVLLFILFIITELTSPLATNLLLGYSDAHIMILNIGMQSITIPFWIILPEKMPTPSVVIPILCWLGCLLGIFALVHSVRNNRQDTSIKLPPELFLLLVFIQSLLIFSSLMIGGLQFSQILQYRNFKWFEWLQALLFIRYDLFINVLTIMGFILLVTNFCILLGLTIRHEKATTYFPQMIRRMVPLVMFLICLLFGGFYFLQSPNYLISLKQPLNGSWGQAIFTGIERDQNINVALDGKDAVFPNGSAFYLNLTQFDYGYTYDVNVRGLDDFSAYPYLRFYTVTEYDGCVSVYVENQGGVDAKRCTFQLSDEEGCLRKHFRKELLRADVELLKAGSTLCLFTLKNEEMIVPEYEEIPITLMVNTSFSDDIRSWNTVRTLPGMAMLSMRGLTISTIPQELAYGPQVTMDNPLEWTSNLEYSVTARNKLDWFHCEKTMLLEMEITIHHSNSRVSVLPPILFIYEVA